MGRTDNFLPGKVKEEESAAAAASVDVPLIAEEEEEVPGASAVTEELVD